MNIWQFLTSDTNLLWTAIVSAFVSATVSYLFKRYETRDKLRAEYEYEQRKRLRELIGRYHGRMLQVATSLDRRFWNLYGNYDRGWLKAGGSYKKLGYYLLSTVYRFLSVCTLIRQFELEALYVDARIAEPDDFIFLNYLNALHWAMTDIELFRGLEYDPNYASDHFFSDSLKNSCDTCWMQNNVITLGQLAERLVNDRSLDEIVQFFDGLSRDEARLRWDRLVIFHLLLVSFISAFGYKVHNITNAQLAKIVSQVRNPQVVSNLIDCLPGLGLNHDRDAKRLRKVCLEFLKNNHKNS